MRRSFQGRCPRNAKRACLDVAAYTRFFSEETRGPIHLEASGAEASSEGLSALRIFDNMFVHWHDLAKSLDAGWVAPRTVLPVESTSLYDMLAFSDDENDVVSALASRLSTLTLKQEQSAPVIQEPSATPHPPISSSPHYHSPSMEPPYAPERATVLPSSSATPAGFACKKCGHTFAMRRTRDVHASKCR